MVESAEKGSAGSPSVLWVVDHLSHGGAMHGAAHYYLAVIPGLDARRFNVKLCVMRGDEAAERRFRAAGIDVIVLGRSKFDIRAVTDLVRLARSSDARILHCHGYGSSNFGRLASILCRAAVVMHQHDDGFSYPWYQRVADAMLRPTCRKVIAVSDSVADAVVSKMGFPRKHVEVLGNGIDLEKFNPEQHSRPSARAEIGVGPDELVIGTVARLRAEKGIDRLIRALPLVLEKCPSAHLVLVGDGPDRDSLRKLAASFDVADRVTFLGQREDIPRMLAAMDVFVLASRSEGFGLSLVEAMAMGKAIVASDLPAVRSLIDGDTSGKLVDSGIPEALASAIVDIAQNPGLSESLGQAARERAKAFGLGAHVEELQRIYLELLA
jgi:glycosyltransferase involved in cell wall biosynthesis